MKLCLKLAALLITAVAVYSVIGCSAPAGFSYQNVSVSISVECGDCPAIIYNPAYPAPSVVGQPAPPGSVVTEPNNGQGGTYLFTAHVTNAPANVTWALYPTPNLVDPTSPSGTSTPVGEQGSSVGSINVASGNTVYYVVNGVPVYTGAALQQAQALGILQGMVLLTATVPTDPNDPSKVVTASQLIQIFGGTNAQGPPTAYLVPRTPTTPAGITTPVISVPRGTSYQFYGGIVGAAPCTSTAACLLVGPTAPINTVDNGAVWEVGPSPFSLATAVQCTTPALCPYGTITQTGLYTAPATPPAITPVVVLISHYVSSVSAFAYVGVQ
jgi:hypothetical protein